MKIAIVAALLFSISTAFGATMVEEWNFTGGMPKTAGYSVDREHAKAAFSVVADAEHPAGKGALRAEIQSPSNRDKPEDIQLMFNAERKLADGEKLRVSFLVKGSEATQATVTMMLTGAPYSAVAKPGSRKFAIETEWKTVTFDTIALATEGKQYRAPGFFLGNSKGTLQFANIKFESVSGSSTTQETLIDADFTFACSPVNNQNKGSLKGQLPASCVDDFTPWNKSVAESSIHEEAGRKFLRIDVKELDRAAQFTLKSEDIPAGYYKLAIEAKSAAGFNIGIRQQSAPHQFFWKEGLVPSTEWQSREFLFRIDPSKEYKVLLKEGKTEAARLRVYLQLREGVTDLLSLKLFKADKEEVEKALAVKEAAKQATLLRPEKDSPNFIRNSRFPLGLPSGWNIWRGANPGEFTVKADTSEVGPSGCPPLLLDGAILRSEPFNTPFYGTGKKCVLSFFYKAKKDFKVAVMAANFNQKVKREHQLANKTLPAADKWTRGELEFTEPDGKTKCLSIEFSDGHVEWTHEQMVSNHGEIKLDSLQVYYGEPGRAYQSGGDCEIALAPVSSEMSEERVQFSDEPSKARYFASGNLKDAVLKAVVYDVNGREKALPEIALVEKPAGELNYAVIPESELGQFRIEAWAERDGKRISPCNELVLTRVRRPLHWGKDAPDSPFGIHVMPQKARSMKAVGINWVRLHDTGSYIGWAELEPEKGKWVFNDREIELYRTANLKLAGMLSTTPAWAADGKPKGERYWDRYFRPKNLDDYANYVRTVVGRYKDRIDLYMICNEPTWNGSGNDSMYWTKDYDQSVSPEERRADSIRHFIELSKVAYANAKAVFPEVQIAGIHASRLAWVNEMLKGGAYGYCDLADFHYYPTGAELTVYGYPGDVLDKYTADAVRIAKEQGKPLLNTEFNPATYDGNVSPEHEDASFDDGTGIYRHTLAWKSPGAALAVANAMATCVMKNLALDIKQVYLYSAHAYSYLSVPSKFKTLFGADGYPSPTYAAFSNLAWLLEDRKFVKCVPVGESVWAHIFAGRGATVAAISGLEGGRYAVPELNGVEALDLFGNLLPAGAKYEERMFYLKSGITADTMAKQLEKRK